MGDHEEPSRGGQSLRIIHLSDIHFGKDHRFGGEITPTGDYVIGAGFPTLAESIRADLEKIGLLGNARNKTSQIVCLTGDLTQTASTNEFKLARLFCKALCDGAESLGPLAVVPGNHDIDWTQHTREDRMVPWSQFLTALRGTYDDWSGERRDVLVRTDLMDSDGVVIAEINSCAYVRKDTEDEHRGRVSMDALQELDKQLSSLDPVKTARCIKVALVHHHPILIPDLAEAGRGYDSIHGAGHLLRILRHHGFHLLLHGHKHNPFTFTEDSLSAQQTERHAYPLFIVCGGSAASKELPDDRSPVNCYNVIDIKWLPDAQQYRCRVETRKLVRTKDGQPLLPTQWRWDPLSADDRSFRPERSLSVSALPPWRAFQEGDEDSQRKAQYEVNRGTFPIVAVRPSLTRGQAHEAVVELRYRRPPKGTIPKKVKSVRWSAGPSHAVYELQEDSAPWFRAAFAYYDSMLIQASVTWEDDYNADLYIFAQLEEIDQ